MHTEPSEHRKPKRGEIAKLARQGMNNDDIAAMFPGFDRNKIAYTAYQARQDAGLLSQRALPKQSLLLERPFRISQKTHDELYAEAKSRGITVYVLVSKLLYYIAKDKMYEAVICDDEDGA